MPPTGVGCLRTTCLHYCIVPALTLRATGSHRRRLRRLTVGLHLISGALAGRCRVSFETMCVHHHYPSTQLRSQHLLGTISTCSPRPNLAISHLLHGIEPYQRNSTAYSTSAVPHSGISRERLIQPRAEMGSSLLGPNCFSSYPLPVLSLHPNSELYSKLITYYNSKCSKCSTVLIPGHTLLQLLLSDSRFQVHALQQLCPDPDRVNAFFWQDWL